MNEQACYRLARQGRFDDAERLERLLEEPGLSTAAPPSCDTSTDRVRVSPAIAPPLAARGVAYVLGFSLALDWHRAFIGDPHHLPVGHAYAYSGPPQ